MIIPGKESNYLADGGTRIAYLISCFHPYNTGNGGHYYSLMNIASSYARYRGDIDIKIFSFGNRRPSALKNFSGPWKHTNVSASNIFLAARSVAEWRPTHIHAYDRRSLFFARSAAIQCGAKVIFTKPGGPNSRYLPIADQNVFFSQENFDFYRRRRSAYQSRFALVPQRTSPIAPREDRLKHLESLLPKGRVRVLRISRVGDYYRDSIEQTISLAHKIRLSGRPASALIIGTVESSSVADILEKSLHEDDFMITDSEFTNKAAELISIADIAVGTGRGFMEAAMVGVPVLCPTRNGLVLLTEGNLASLKDKNFSARVESSCEVVDSSLQNIICATKNSLLMDQLRSETREISKNNFDISFALHRYDEIYRSAENLAKPTFDMAILFMGVVKAVLRSILTSFGKKWES